MTQPEVSCTFLCLKDQLIYCDIKFCYLLAAILEKLTAILKKMAAILNFWMLYIFVLIRDIKSAYLQLLVPSWPSNSFLDSLLSLSGGHLEKMAAMLDFNLANVVFVFSGPKRLSVPNLLLVSLSAIFWWKKQIICPAKIGDVNLC